MGNSAETAKIGLIRYVDFPLSVEGVAVLNTDGTFDICINACLPEEQQAEILVHFCKVIGAETKKSCGLVAQERRTHARQY